MPTPSLIRDSAERSRALALIGLMTLTIAAAIVAAAWPSGWGTIAALVACLVAELMVARVSRFAVAALQRAGGGSPARTALRMTAVVLLAGRSLSAPILVATAATAAAVTAIAISVEAARAVVVRARRLPLVTRNIDLGDFAVPKPPPAVVMDAQGLDAIGPLFAAIGLTVAIHHGGAVVGAAIGLAAAGLVVVIPAVVLGVAAVGLARAKLRGRLTEAASAAIERLSPEVILYFAATADELYQVRMWLEPLARLDRQVAVILRSYAVFDALGDVSLPVICTPYNGTIASLPLPPRVVGMFVTHSGNNLSLIRRPEIRSVFIGHGDSDKPDSVNPFARVYDEVWVAGALGGRRYAQAGVGVRESAIVAVGRPQTTVSAATPTEPPTILYAPTWEGWGDDPHHSSLAQVGVELVERLAARSDVQVRYRPHPLTGRRNRDLRAAHRRILELVASVPSSEPLAESFAASAGLIADVSSIVNDYLPYDRPYAVVDSRDLGPERFVARFPSTAGGFILTPDLDGLDEFVAAALGGADPHRTVRRELIADVLGDPVTAPRRFAAAVDRLLTE